MVIDNEKPAHNSVSSDNLTFTVIVTQLARIFPNMAFWIVVKRHVALNQPFKFHRDLPAKLQHTTNPVSILRVVICIG